MREKAMKYKVGDKVLIRQWDDMKQEHGLDRYGYINFFPCFSKQMKKYCGTVQEISHVVNGYYIMKRTGRSFSEHSIERKVWDMTKADLKDGMVCRIGNGETFIWLNGKPRNNMSIMSKVRDDLKNDAGVSDFEIVEIYETGGETLNEMLDVDRFGTLIWKREKPKEMTVAEIEKALGYPVKIVKEGDKC